MGYAATQDEAVKVGRYKGCGRLDPWRIDINRGDAGVVLCWILIPTPPTSGPTDGEVDEPIRSSRAKLLRSSGRRTTGMSSTKHPSASFLHREGRNGPRKRLSVPWYAGSWELKAYSTKLSDFWGCLTDTGQKSRARQDRIDCRHRGGISGDLGRSLEDRSIDIEALPEMIE